MVPGPSGLAGIKKHQGTVAFGSGQLGKLANGGFREGSGDPGMAGIDAALEEETGAGDILGFSFAMTGEVEEVEGAGGSEGGLDGAGLRVDGGGLEVVLEEGTFQVGFGQLMGGIGVVGDDKPAATGARVELGWGVALVGEGIAAVEPADQAALGEESRFGVEGAAGFLEVDQFPGDEWFFGKDEDGVEVLTSFPEQALEVRGEQVVPDLGADGSQFIVEQLAMFDVSEPALFDFGVAPIDIGLAVAGEGGGFEDVFPGEGGGIEDELVTHAALVEAFEDGQLMLGSGDASGFDDGGGQDQAAGMGWCSGDHMTLQFESDQGHTVLANADPGFGGAGGGGLDIEAGGEGLAGGGGRDVETTAADGTEVEAGDEFEGQGMLEGDWGGGLGGWGSGGCGERFAGHGDIDGGGFIEGHFGIHFSSEMAGVLFLGEFGEGGIGWQGFRSGGGRGTGEQATASGGGGRGGQGWRERSGSGRCGERGRG